MASTDRKTMQKALEKFRIIHDFPITNAEIFNTVLFHYPDMSDEICIDYELVESLECSIINVAVNSDDEQRLYTRIKTKENMTKEEFQSIEFLVPEKIRI